jgi:hypothetical protein
MSQEDRAHLLSEIEEIRTTIEELEPEVYKQEAAGSESSRRRLLELRKDLARDMEQLHES